MKANELRNGFESLKAVFFDMDGVLYDSMGNNAIAWNQAFASLGLDFPHEKVYLNEGRTGSSTVQMVFLEQLGREANPEELSEVYRRKSQYFEALPAARPFVGMVDFMRRLDQQGIAIWVVTGSAQELLLEGLCLDFPGLVEKNRIISAKDVKIGKPHPEPYLKALEKSGHRREEVVVIENAPLGVQSARAAGIRTIGFNTGILADGLLSQEGAEVVVKQMHQLEQVFFSN